MNTYERAVDYLDRGFSVFPVRSGGKKPAVKWKQYQNQHASKEKLQEWFDGTDKNIGIVTGKISGLLVLDIDGEDGEKSVQDKAKPPTVTVETPGGIHYYYQWPNEDISINAGLFNGVDYRGEGGYVVAPPSSRDDGNYEFMTALDPDNTSIAQPPEWLIEAIKEDQGSTNTENTSDETIPFGENRREEQYKMLAKNAPTSGSMNWRKILQNGVSEGERNDTAFRTACYLYNEDFDRYAVMEFMQIWNQKCSPPLPREELKDVVERANEYDVQGKVREVVETESSASNLQERFTEIQRVEYEEGEYLFRFKYESTYDEKVQIEMTETQFASRTKFTRKIFTKSGDKLGPVGSQIHQEIFDRLQIYLYENADRVDETDTSRMQALCELIIEELDKNVYNLDEEESVRHAQPKKVTIKKDGKYHASTTALSEKLSKMSSMDPNKREVAEAFEKIGFNAEKRSKPLRVGDSVVRMWEYAGEWPPRVPTITSDDMDDDENPETPDVGSVA